MREFMTPRDRSCFPRPLVAESWVLVRKCASVPMRFGPAAGESIFRQLRTGTVCAALK